MKVLSSFYDYGTHGDVVLTKWEKGDIWNSTKDDDPEWDIPIEERKYAVYRTNLTNRKPCGLPVRWFKSRNEAQAWLVLFRQEATQHH